MPVNEELLNQQLLDPSTRREAFSQMVRVYSEPLYWKIRQIVLVHDDANDVLQNVFLKAWRNLEDFQGKSKVSTWLYRIAINESLDFIRRQNATISTEADMSVASHLRADEYFDGDEAQALLQEAIASLPEVQRAVFTLRYYDEMKYSDMSQLLGTSEGALKASYHIAVKKISAYVKAHE